MMDYCSRFDLKISQLVFSIHGERIETDDIAEGLLLDKGDVIDVLPFFRCNVENKSVMTIIHHRHYHLQQ